jgi:hypothetical protein
MQIHLVLPGLLWPGASLMGPAAGIELPALAGLLGVGQRRTGEFEPLDRQFARALGFPLPAGEDPLPLAALRRLGESTPPSDADADWLCADPVNLSFAREHLLLNDFSADEPGADEVVALIDSLNDTFADLGRFEACTAARWYLRLTGPTRARLFPLHDVIGRPIRHFLPEGEDARRWQRTMNEVQVLLHHHPVNPAREAAGHRPVNSLWFWGAGRLTGGSPAPPLAAVQSHEPLVRGIARAAGVEATPPDLGTALRQDTVVVLDTLLEPARRLDLDAWRSNLAALERDWFAPLAAALRDRRLQGLTLTAPGDRSTLELVVRAGDRWKFWRKPLAFDLLLKSLTPAVPAFPGETPAAHPAPADR